MTLLVIIPFALFFCCVLAQFPLRRELRRVLVERHPEVWREISVKAWFIDSAVGRYVWGGKAKALNDPYLMEAVNRLRLLQAVSVAAWLAILAVILTSAATGGH